MYSKLTIYKQLVLLFFVFNFSTLVIEARSEQPSRIAVFQGEGVGQSAKKLVEALRDTERSDVIVTRITADEIRTGKLSDVDVLVHPGGSGSKQGRALGANGQKAVADFVRNGGGYLGVCAGAYLATNDYSWSLNLIDAKCVDRRHWNRGTGIVDIKLSAAASTFFRMRRRHDGSSLRTRPATGTTGME